MFGNTWGSLQKTRLNTASIESYQIAGVHVIDESEQVSSRYNMQNVFQHTFRTSKVH